MAPLFAVAVASPQDILLSYGLPGVIILAMAGVIVYQDREGKKKDEIIRQQSDARVQDAKDVNSSLKGPITDIVDITKRMYDAILSNDRRGN